MKKEEEQTYEAPLAAGIACDAKGKYIGKYLFLQEGDQEIFDAFCKTWIDTYHDDSRFFITIDLETTGLDPILDEILLVSISWDGEHAIVFEWKTFDLTWFRRVLETVWISNQRVKFDAKFLYCKTGIVPKLFLCTQTGVQLGWAGCWPHKTFSLDTIAQTLLLGYSLNKAVRKEFIGWVPDTKFNLTQVEYAAIDSMITHKAAFPIMKRLYNEELLSIWEEVERPLLQHFITEEVRGLKIDVKKLNELYNQKLKELNSTYANIKELLKTAPNRLPLFSKHKTFGNDFNPGSYIQVVEVLKAFNIKVASTAKDELNSQLAETPLPILQEIIKFRETNTVITKFLRKWIDVHINPKTGCIHHDLNICGTETGRFSASDPNVLAIDRNLRSMIIAREGYKIVSLDYSSFEFRVMAALSEEDALVEAYSKRAELLPIIKELAKSHHESDPDKFCKKVLAEDIKVDSKTQGLIHSFLKTDIHRLNASIMFNTPILEVTNDQRNAGKCVCLDTYVHTTNGIIKLKDLLPKRLKADTYYPLKLAIVNDEGITISDSVYYAGLLSGYEIKTKSGATIKCSENHKFRTCSKLGDYAWKKASDLKEGDPLYTIHNPVVKSKAKLPKFFKDELDFIKIVTAFLKFGTINEDRIEFPIGLDLSKLTSYKIKETKFIQYIVSAELARWLNDNCQNIPEYILQCGDENVLILFLVNLLDLKNPSRALTTKNNEVLIQTRNLLLRLGVSSYISSSINSVRTGATSIGNLGLSSLGKTNLDAIIIGKSNCMTKDSLVSWKLAGSDRIHRKLLKDMLEDSTCLSLHSHPDPEGLAKKCLSDREFKLCSTNIEKNITRDDIISIKKIAKIPMGDLVVPSNHTVVYNGFISHNTAGYLIAYGGEAARLQVAFAKEGFYHTLAECKELLQTVFRVYTKLKELVEYAHGLVLDPGYYQSVLGRRRYFRLPPKYYGSVYDKALKDAQRESFNTLGQTSNADAMKLALVEAIKLKDEYPPDTLFIPLAVHDEMVCEIKEEYAEEIAEKIEKIMIATGEFVIRNKISIETSKLISDTWGK